jgi:hypothetical protein
MLAERLHPLHRLQTTSGSDRSPLAAANRHRLLWQSPIAPLPPPPQLAPLAAGNRKPLHPKGHSVYDFHLRCSSESPAPRNPRLSTHGSCRIFRAVSTPRSCMRSAPATACSWKQSPPAASSGHRQQLRVVTACSCKRLHVVHAVCKRCGRKTSQQGLAPAGARQTTPTPPSAETPLIPTSEGMRRPALRPGAPSDGAPHGLMGVSRCAWGVDSRPVVEGERHSGMAFPTALANGARHQGRHGVFGNGSNPSRWGKD